MKAKPNWVAGTVVEYKAGKSGYHFGLDNGMKFRVKKLIPPNRASARLGPATPWSGWLFTHRESDCLFPCGWFREVK